MNKLILITIILIGFIYWDEFKPYVDSANTTIKAWLVANTPKPETPQTK